MSAQRKFLEDVKRTIEHEIRGVALTLHREDVKPCGPHDSDAEQDVLSALLCEHTTIEALAPLAARHFYSSFNRQLFAALAVSAERNLQAITDTLSMCGPVLEELTIIRDATPFTSAARLREHVATIMNRWAERELIRTMQQIDAEVRVGAITHDGARARLRQHFMEISG